MLALSNLTEIIVFVAILIFDLFLWGYVVPNWYVKVMMNAGGILFLKL